MPCSFGCAGQFEYLLIDRKRQGFQRKNRFASLCGKRNRPGDGMKLMRLLLSFNGGTETAGLAHREILNRGA